MRDFLIFPFLKNILARLIQLSSNDDFPFLDFLDLFVSIFLFSLVLLILFWILQELIHLVPILVKSIYVTLNSDAAWVDLHVLVISCFCILWEVERSREKVLIVNDCVFIVIESMKVLWLLPQNYVLVLFV